MPDSPIPLPARIGKYELLEFLGGGMSHVYRAQDTVLQRMVAVKILTEEGSADTDTKARFLREARLASGILHDNIIRVYDFGEEHGRPYMVMEFLSGQDLRSVIRNRQAGDLVSRLRIALDLARALAHIHTHNIVHRDIKPDNVHLDQQGKVRLMDFGIAKTADYSLTRPGFTLGTPHYMAPEQVRGQQVGEPADIYAFGILLYELLTGDKPFVAENVGEIFRQILQQPLSLEPLERTGAPRELIDLIARMSAKEAPARPQSFEEVIRELRSIRERLKQPAAITRDVSTASAPASPRRPPPPAPTLLAATARVPAPAPPPAAAAYKPWVISAAIVGAMLALLLLDLIFRA